MNRQELKAALGEAFACYGLGLPLLRLMERIPALRETIMEHRRETP